MGMTPKPEHLLRLGGLLSLVGYGLGAIARALEVQAPVLKASPYPELALYCGMALLIFILLYAQYRGVPRLMGYGLHRVAGYIEAGGCLAIAVYGAIRTWHPWTEFDPAVAASDVVGHAVAGLAFFGEGTFLANVVWSYTSEVPLEAPVKKAPPGAKARRWRLPREGAGLFGLAAAIFGAGGLLTLLTNFPPTRFPLPVGGRVLEVPPGLLWIAAAVVFGIFAGLYRLLEGKVGGAYNVTASRAHFLVTVFALYDWVRLAMGWEMSLGVRWPVFDARKAWFEALAMLFAAGVAFAANVLVSLRGTAARA